MEKRETAELAGYRSSLVLPGAKVVPHADTHDLSGQPSGYLLGAKVAEGLVIAPYTAIDPAQAKTLLLFPALNHFVLNSKNTTSVIDLERRDQTSDHFCIRRSSMQLTYLEHVLTCISH